MSTLRVCHACGTQFKAAIPTKKFCSTECKNRSCRKGYVPYQGSLVAAPVEVADPATPVAERIAERPTQPKKKIKKEFFKAPREWGLSCDPYATGALKSDAQNCPVW